MILQSSPSIKWQAYTAHRIVCLASWVGWFVEVVRTIRWSSWRPICWFEALGPFSCYQSKPYLSLNFFSSSRAIHLPALSSCSSNTALGPRYCCSKSSSGHWLLCSLFTQTANWRRCRSMNSPRGLRCSPRACLCIHSRTSQSPVAKPYFCAGPDALWK